MTESGFMPDVRLSSMFSSVPVSRIFRCTHQICRRPIDGKKRNHKQRLTTVLICEGHTRQTPPDTLMGTWSQGKVDSRDVRCFISLYLFGVSFGLFEIIF
jgi:hypothetical protein